MLALTLCYLPALYHVAVEVATRQHQVVKVKHVGAVGQHRVYVDLLDIGLVRHCVVWHEQFREWQKLAVFLAHPLELLVDHVKVVLCLPVKLCGHSTNVDQRAGGWDLPAAATTRHGELSPSADKHQLNRQKTPQTRQSAFVCPLLCSLTLASVGGGGGAAPMKFF